MTAATPFGANTHAGRKYAHNEDSVGWDEARGVYIVADGMGGHARGEVASRIVRDVLLDHADDESLEHALAAAHERIVATTSGAEVPVSMGSTAVVARIRGAVCEIAWVGDSRAYLLRNGKIRSLTRDHSYVELLLDRGDISPAEARSHPDRNLVMQTLGMAEPAPSSVRVPLRSGDRLLLCSDGLNDELSDDEIGALLRDHADPHRAAARLVEAALANGGRDNVSVIVIDPPVSGSFWHRLRLLPTFSAVWQPVLIGWLAAVLLFSLWYGIIKS